MVQDQLVDYISSQLKLGVSSDAIKSALVSAGWVAGDVDDTLKKVQGAPGASVGMGAGVSVGAGVGAVSTKPAGMGASPSTSSPMGTSSPSAATVTTAVGAATASTSPASKTGPQMIRVSDLVSASPSMSGSSAAKPAAAKMDPAALGGKISGNTFQAMPTGSGTMGGGMGGSMKGGSGAMVAWIVAVIFFVGFGGLAWYFYSANGALSTKISLLTTQSTSISSQLATLQSQMDASSTGMAAQIASLTTANQDLELDLSFYAVPSTGASSTAITISTGWLTVAKGLYWITTPQGAKIAVANSSDAKIAAELKPLVGDTVQAVGTYVPGSDLMTLETVTDLSPAAAPAAATSTNAAASSTTTDGAMTTSTAATTTAP